MLKRSPGIETTLSSASDPVAAYLRRARPLPLLAAAGALQLAIGVAVAFLSAHNHFVWYSGGDATEYWTSSWMIAQGALPQALIGYGVPVLWSWVPLLTGTSLLSGLPVITIAQLLVFVPLCVVLVWAIGDLLFGRLFAWWATALWVVAPFLMLWAFRSDYATEFRDLFLAPHWYGLTAMADLPSLVAVLAAAWATLRLLASRAPLDALLSGVLTGIAIGIKPANGFFIPAVLLLVLATRSPRSLAAWCGGVAPPLLTLALWKAKGRGNLPVLADRGTREAAGDHPVVAVANRYVHLDLSHLQKELSDLAEVFWSVRLLEFLVIAGLLGALRRSPLKGAFLGLWFAGFCIVKGSSTVASIPTLNYWRYVEPGLPALLFLVASVVFLVPRRGRAYARATQPRPLPGGLRTIGASLAVLVLIPLVLVAAIPAASSELYVRDSADNNEAPLSNALAVTTSRGARDAVRLDWRSPGTSSTRAYYVVYRSEAADTCQLPAEGAKECDLNMRAVGLTRRSSYVDHPGAGAHWYRIGLLANYRDAVDGSDLILVGPPTAATSAG